MNLKENEYKKRNNEKKRFDVFRHDIVSVGWHLFE